MALLTADEIQERLDTLEGWDLRDKEIRKTYTTKDFVDSLAFVTKVAFLAEKANHHPDVLIQWNRVTLTLSTHSEGGITNKDFKLATQIEGI
ncbi:MAG: 4a-hydroxytetrahydrobiopterin dehydratase [Thermodesulfobacteriota bacterium]